MKVFFLFYITTIPGETKIAAGDARREETGHVAATTTITPDKFDL